MAPDTDGLRLTEPRACQVSIGFVCESMTTIWLEHVETLDSNTIRMNTPDSGSYTTCGYCTTYPLDATLPIMPLMPNDVSNAPARLYTKTALLTASTTSLPPAAKLGSAGVVTAVFPLPGALIAVCSPPPSNVVSASGVDAIAGVFAASVRATCDDVAPGSARMDSDADTGLADHATVSAATNTDTRMKLRRTFRF